MIRLLVEKDSLDVSVKENTEEGRRRCREFEDVV